MRSYTHTHTHTDTFAAEFIDDYVTFHQKSLTTYFTYLIYYSEFTRIRIHHHHELHIVRIDALPLWNLLTLTMACGKKQHWSLLLIKMNTYRKMKMKLKISSNLYLYLILSKEVICRQHCIWRKSIVKFTQLLQSGLMEWVRDRLIDESHQSILFSQKEEFTYKHRIHEMDIQHIILKNRMNTFAESVFVWP